MTIKTIRGPKAYKPAQFVCSNDRCRAELEAEIGDGFVRHHQIDAPDVELICPHCKAKRWVALSDFDA